MQDKLLTPTGLYSEAQRRLTELKLIKIEIEKRMKKYPSGKIHVIVSPNRIQYYLRTEADDKSGKYIPRKDEKKVKTYLQKRYDEQLYKLISREIDNLTGFLSKSSSIIDSERSLYSKYPPEIKNYITPIDISDNDYTEEWLQTPFRPKEIKADIPVFITDRGEHVRSKSELNIANLLNKHNIPYKYECPFVLSNGNIIYPDFTTLNKKERKEIYWEHRGMMDDRDYSKHSVSRIKLYETENIYIGDRLIITEETSNYALGTNEIENIIKHYF